MKLADFHKQIDRLIKVYGGNRYPQERIEMIFERVGCIDIESFKTAVSRFIGETEKPPFSQDFIDALGSVLAEAVKREREAKLALLAPCFTCNGSGSVTMYEKATGCEYAFQCTCERGKVLNPCFSKQYDGMGEKYASHRAWMAGKFDRVKAIKESTSRFVEPKKSTIVIPNGMKPLSFDV